jgi:DNA invertase Pin-like site-specific DNA recombinase
MRAAERAAFSRKGRGAQAIDTTTPAGRLMFQVTGAFAEFERSMIRQRVNAGLKRAVEAGKQLGRPRIDPALEKRIRGQLRGGKGMLAIAKDVGVGSGTVQRIKREMEEGRPLEGNRPKMLGECQRVDP